MLIVSGELDRQVALTSLDFITGSSSSESRQG
jgi:hypothetical protein